MNRKALFFDIDGTLLSEVTDTVPESTVEALAEARKNGHLVFINTGRAKAQLFDIQYMVEVDGYLCGCGTYVESEGKILYHHVIEEPKASEIRQAVEDSNLFCILEGKDGCYMSGETSRFPVAESIRTALAPCIVSQDWKKNCGTFDKFCVMSDEQSNKTLFFRRLGLDIDVIDRGNGFYECVPAGHSKATAIDVILEKYGIPLEQAYVFGDSTNDLSMFEHVPNAILMGKHDAELEPYASFVTKNVEQDGIAYAMKKLGII